MASVDVQEVLAKLVQGIETVAAGEADSWDKRVRDTPVEEWTDDHWNYANQRGLIPPDRQQEYVMRMTQARHKAEMEALMGGQLAGNFGGNLPGYGTATVAPENATGVGLGSTGPGGAAVSPEERLLQIEAEEERLRQERAVLTTSVGSSDASATEGDDYDERSQPELKSEVEARNAGRSEEDKIQPASNRKADLVAALREDDATSETEPE